ncbi:MAG: hypothetical protein [Bacteriophage sp.]|nr:MAG: hypothetical protein [Bacteriophage sp.]
MKPIIAGCLALVISGTDTGKTVRALSRHKSGDVIDLPNGQRAQVRQMGDVAGWLCIGNVHAVDDHKKPYPDGAGFALYHEKALMRIDAEGDDDLIEEFGMEECANVMEEQMKREGIKRLW